jgi:hypothetical protein
MYRVADVLDLHPEPKQRVIDAVRAAVADLPFKPVDIEWCGTYVFGIAMLQSDVDINLAMESWEAQVQARRVFDDPVYRARVLAVMESFWESDKLGLNIAATTPENKSYNIVYSFSDDKLHDPMNRRPGNVPWRGHMGWNGFLLKWEPKPERPHRGGRWEEDEFVAELPQWEAIYGDKLLRYEEQWLPDAKGILRRNLIHEQHATDRPSPNIG